MKMSLIMVWNLMKYDRHVEPRHRLGLAGHSIYSGTPVLVPRSNSNEMQPSRSAYIESEKLREMSGCSVEARACCARLARWIASRLFANEAVVRHAPENWSGRPPDDLEALVRKD